MFSHPRPPLIVKFWTLILIAFGAPSFAEPDFSGIHPMIQTSTGDTSVQINALVPRLKNYVFTATPVDGGATVEGKLMGDAIRDPDKLLHEKVLKVFFSGLKPKTEYTLVMNELFRDERQVVDTRSFKTASKETGELKMLTVSCMCDENKYRLNRQKVWSNAVAQNPEVIVLLGDQTYVDSFDYVERGKATPLDIWMRHFRSFDQNPLTRSKKLFATYSTWDDHDTGIDNGNETTPTINEARKAFLALYGGDSIPGFVEKTPNGVESIVTLKGQNIVIFDTRSFREPYTNDSRYAHMGKEQEDWFFNRLKDMKGPIHLMKGDMWGTPTVLGESFNGKPPKRITESFFGDHPRNYAAFMERLANAKKAVAFYSGDIHFSEVLAYGPQFKGNSFYTPYKTVEITSSPAHSIIFFPKAGEPEFWANPQRIIGSKNYNTVVVTSTPQSEGQFTLNIQSFGEKIEALFKTTQAVVCEAGLAK